VIHEIYDVNTNELVTQYSETKTFGPTGWPDAPLQDEVEGKPQLDEYDVLMAGVDCSQAKAVVGTGETMYSGTVDLSTSYEDELYVLKDPLRNCHYTVDLKEYFNDDDDDTPTDDNEGTLNPDIDNVWGNFSVSDKNTVAADAHYGHKATFDYFLETFGHRGVYNSPTKGVYSRVHFGANYANAFWYNGRMTYGDGDSEFFGPLACADVVGHELAHGVTEATANLIYEGESGGLNEATSDIFGTMIEFFAKDRPYYAPNWLIGEQIIKLSGLFLRSMIRPSDDNVLYPPGYVSYDCYCPGIEIADVHFSSGVANHFLYLLSEGTTNGIPSKTCDSEDCIYATGRGTLTGIGKEKAAQI